MNRRATLDYSSGRDSLHQLNAGELLSTVFARDRVIELTLKIFPKRPRLRIVGTMPGGDANTTQVVTYKHLHNVNINMFQYLNRKQTCRSRKSQIAKHDPTKKVGHKYCWNTTQMPLCALVGCHYLHNWGHKDAKISETCCTGDINLKHLLNIV